MPNFVIHIHGKSRNTKISTDTDTQACLRLTVRQFKKYLLI